MSCPLSKVQCENEIYLVISATYLQVRKDHGLPEDTQIIEISSHDGLLPWLLGYIQGEAPALYQEVLRQCDMTPALLARILGDKKESEQE